MSARTTERTKQLLALYLREIDQGRCDVEMLSEVLELATRTVGQRTDAASGAARKAVALGVIRALVEVGHEAAVAQHLEQAAREREESTARHAATGPSIAKFQRIFETLDDDQKAVCGDGVSLLVEARAPGASGSQIAQMVRAYEAAAVKLTVARAIRGDQDGVEGIRRVVNTFVTMVREEHPETSSRRPAKAARRAIVGAARREARA